MRKIFLILLCSLYFTVSVKAASSAPKIRLSVANFVDKANAHVAGQVYENSRITDIFMDVLSASTSNIEVTKSKSFQLTSEMTAENAVIAGKSDNSQYILLGTLTKINGNMSYTYGGFWGATPKTATNTYIAGLDTRVIDVSSGKIVFSATGTGLESYSYDVAKQSKNPYSKENQQKMTKLYEDTINSAMAAASSMAAEKICAFLTGEYPQVSSLKANLKTKRSNKAKQSDKKNAKTKVSLGSLKINRGTSAGLKKGILYRIFFEGEEIFDFNGNSLGREKFNIAIAEVTEARTNSSTAEVIAGIFKNIHNDDKAEQITPEEAEAIIERGDFAQNRFSEFLKDL